MYQYKDLYVIDFSSVKCYLEMHKVIKDALDFPDYYGQNWSAFWDCLTDMVGDPINIEVRGLEVIERKFNGAVETLINILKDFKHYNNDRYVNDIHIVIVSGDRKVEIA